MKVFIVTEAGKKYGFGHLMRCLSLEQAFRRRRIAPKFIVNADDSARKVLAGKDVRFLNWPAQKAAFFKEIDGADIVVIDSYVAGRPLYEEIARSAKVAVYIDDNKRLRYPAGVVLNMAVYGPEMKYPKDAGVEYLLGAKYAFLRDDFRRIPKKRARPQIQKILITFGGSDFLDMTPKVLKILNRHYPDMVKYAVVGNFFTNEDAIRKAADRNTRIVKQATAAVMKKLMLDADLAVSAAGQTLIELSRVGVATLGICVAGNQKRHLKKWQALGLSALFKVRSESILEKAVVTAIERFSSAQSRREFSNRITKIVNPDGGKAVVDALVGKLKK
jgi:UDP-2,4-diacetamido-2,4,6-trideoxy-beta-L-altropyranose hydrolase